MKALQLRHILSIFVTAISILAVILGVASTHAMPKRVSVGDHQLRISVTGAGSPTVILETFGPASLETWNRLQPKIARFAKVVSYDHAGYWGSEPGPKPRDATQIARELREALRSAHLPPPYVLVGYSFGGSYIRVFAGLYPDEVKGMVFLDPSQEEFMGWLNKHFPKINVVTEVDRLKQDEWGVQWSSLNMARDAQLPTVPISLITATRIDGPLGRKLLPILRETHESWLRQFPHAKHIITTNSDHGLVFTEPEMIADVVKNVIDAVREVEAKTRR